MPLQYVSLFYNTIRFYPVLGLGVFTGLGVGVSTGACVGSDVAVGGTGVGVGAGLGLDVGVGGTGVGVAVGVTGGFTIASVTGTTCFPT